MDDLSRTGVYCIVNLVNGKRYVGSASRSFRRRWVEHRSDLEIGKHHSVLLQRSWVKYGSSSFEFRILRITEPHEAVEYEQSFIDFYKAADKRYGYNIAAIAGSNIGSRHSKQSRKKMSESHKGRTPSDETRAKLSESLKGRVFTEEHRRKLSESNKGKVLTPEHKAALLAVNLGCKHSQERCDKKAVAMRGQTRTLESRAKMVEAQARIRLLKTTKGNSNDVEIRDKEDRR